MQDKLMDLAEQIEIEELIECGDKIDAFMKENGIWKYEYQYFMSHIFDSPGCDIYSFGICCIKDGELFLVDGQFTLC